MTERKKDIIAILVLLLVIIIRFSPMIFQATPIYPDGWKSYYPWRADFSETEIKTIFYDINMEYGVWFPMVQEEIKNGNFPHWNQYSSCGTPLYANHLVPIFHVPFALALLAPAQLITGMYSLIMAIFGTLFFYWFLRNWRLSQFVSLFGGLAFFLSGWMMYVYPPEVATFIWIAPILLFHDRFLERNKLSDACLGAFCIGQLLIAGYPIHVAHFFYFVAIYFLWRRFHKSFKWEASVKRWIVAVLIMAVAGGLISAVQNYPTYNYSRESNRRISSEKKQFESTQDLIARKKGNLEKAGKDFSVGNLILYQLSKKSLIINPRFDRDIYTTRQFTGSIIVFLALIGLFTASRRFRAIKIYFLLIAFLCFVPPVYQIVARIIPGWSITMFLPLETFYFILFFLAALGLDKLSKLHERSNLVMTTAIAVVILQFALLLIPPLHTYNREYEIFRWSESLDKIAMGVYLGLTALLLVIMGIHAWGRRIHQSVAIICLVIFMSVGLLAAFYQYAYFAHPSPMSFNDDVAKIKEICDDGRIIRYFPDNFNITRGERQDSLFPPNLPAKFKMNDVFGYDSLMLGNYSHFFDVTAPDTVMRDRIMFTLKTLESLNPKGLFVQATGLEYCFAKDEPELEEMFGPPVLNEPFQIYKLNRKTPSFARLICDYELLEDYDKDINTDDFRNKILLSDEPAFSDGSVLKSSGKLRNYQSSKINLKKTNTTVELEFNAPQDCLLYIADTYHPLWRAKLDGEEVEIIEANLAFRAIAVPEGNHKLFMWYDGIEVVRGGIVSAAALIFLILIGLLDRKPQKENTEK